MNAFTSTSQAGQDLLIYELLVKPEQLTEGWFLDIGCCDPIEISNTYALEELGWGGLLVDNDPGAVRLCILHRSNPTIQADGTTLDWREALDRFELPKTLDYLSLDVDAATLPTLQNLMLANRRFRVATIEHDSYRFGPGPRDAMRAILEKAGYLLICADVCSSDSIPYEDWWVDPKLVPIERFERFICHDKKWTEIFPA